MNISVNDKNILRKLGEATAVIASESAQQKKAGLWTQLNDLQPVRPMLWIYQLPWSQMEIENELTLQCKDPFLRSIENELRRQLYQWRNLPGDMIVEPLIYCRKVIHNSGFGIEQLGHREVTEDSIYSQEFEPQFNELADIEKIKFPQITYDHQATAERQQILEDIFSGILEVRPYGVGMQWFTLWDSLIRWYGVETAMLDLILKPEVVHAALQRLLDAWLHQLEQFKALNLLSRCDRNVSVGSGGLAYTAQLPQANFNAENIQTIDQWGCGNAQIFSEVSPEMHEEFSLQYERKWLENFGMNYYGCCEPLHNKFDIIKSIPNLRKISCSPWCDLEKMAEQVERKYVISYKPNPAIFCEDGWDLKAAEQILRSDLEKTRGCNVEIIAKDISTLRDHPQRIWEWAEMASRVCKEF
jgi:hypothetical protein